MENGIINIANRVGTQDTLTVLLTGDFCPVCRTEKAVMEGRSQEMTSPLAPILKDKDISIVNLEAPLTRMETPIRKCGPNLKGDPACIGFLTAAGFDIANLANNHIKDFGPVPVVETVNLLNKHGIASVGAAGNLSEAKKPLIIERKGKKVAFLAYAENEFTIADDDSAGAAPINPLDNIRQIREVSASNDITIVLIHGGNEYCPVPSPRMIHTYREYAKAGASAVVATHTHCPQGIEIVDGVPIVYSMGNFLFDYPFPEEECREDSFWWKGYLVKIVFSSHSAVSVEAIPCSSGPDGTSVKLLSGCDKDSFLHYLGYISDIISGADAIKNLWYAWCLSKGPEWIEEFRKAQYPVDIDDIDAFGNMMALRNGFTCEAHKEVIETFLRMVCEGKIPIAEKFAAKLAKLQKGIVAD